VTEVSGQGISKKIESIRINLRDLSWSQVFPRDPGLFHPWTGPRDPGLFHPWIPGTSPGTTPGIPSKVSFIMKNETVA
jgi:hypothetical protein